MLPICYIMPSDFGKFFSMHKRRVRDKSVTSRRDPRWRISRRRHQPRIPSHLQRIRMSPDANGRFAHIIFHHQFSKKITHRPAHGGGGITHNIHDGINVEGGASRRPPSPCSDRRLDQKNQNCSSEYMAVVVVNLDEQASKSVAYLDRQPLYASIVGIPCIRNSVFSTIPP